MPLVSVIIPAYNHEKFVQDAISSIINQTYENIELLVIDDGSKDSTWNKIQEMKELCEKRFKSIVLETQSNHGTCFTLNRLFSLCSGKYVFLIASDDIAYPQIIEKEVDFLENNPDYSLVVCDNEFIDTNGVRCFWDENQNIVYDEKEAKFHTFAENLNIKNKKTEEFGTYKSLLLGNHIPNGYTIRKSILDMIEPFTPEAPLEDYFLMLQLSKYCKMKYIDETLYSYRWHENNTVKNTKLINEYYLKTWHYEKRVFNKIDKSKLLPEVIDIYLNDFTILTKSQGIANLFEILTYKNFTNKIKVIKLFNKEILRYNK